MIDERLRRADPAADWRVDPGSAPAPAMLTDILATPRTEPPQPRLRLRRLAVAGAVGATAVAAPVMWTGGGPNDAYPVDTQPDGSVKLTVRWEELDDVDRLAATPRRAGIPTEITSGAPDRYYCASHPSATARRTRSTSSTPVPSSPPPPRATSCGRRSSRPAASWSSRPSTTRPTSSVW